ncbi:MULTISPECIES: AMP-binding protein [Ramlibacter]|uniref:AMP-binding protein n=1 Tax=Ramlibacter aquaticus TaxID=2780094 RepID=A0ABR9SIF4_9BURK|nr:MULTISPECIES: AMP-binding protein [Ramlibacter]MBE7942115.1 AMP-binding protein [Ramlibacter aquaticus]
MAESATPALPLLLHEILAAQAGLRPDAPAIRFGERQLDYAALAQAVGQAASALWHRWGVRPGDRVAWLGANHPGQIVLLFALARLGAALVPLNFRLAPGEWEAQLQATTPGLLLHDAAWAAAARALAQRVGIAVAGVDALDAGGAPAPVHAGPDAPALLVFTSGTTGAPRAAVHTQAMLRANMAIAAQVQGLRPDDRVLTVLPMFHVGGLCIQTLPALALGAEVLLHARFAPEAALDAIAHDRPTLTLVVPAVMKALVEHPRWAATDLSSLRAAWAGSSLLPAPLVRAFHERGLPVCNVYGATETGPFSVALPPAFALSHAGACGWPAPGVALRCVDPRDGVGELWLRGPNVIRRYWPDVPAVDAQGWFHTGDLARQAADGSWTIAGRVKELIISGGENIHPAEIEAVLAEHPAVLECAAFGLPDPQWGEVVAVAVVCAQPGPPPQAALQAHLAARIARYKLPRRWLWLDALPRTALGKVQRPALQALAARG